jgi:hypothetical protein
VRRRAHVTGILGAIGKEIKSFLKAPYDVTPDGLRVTLTIKTDRRSKHLTLGENRIEALAEDVIRSGETDDEYVIITGTGQKISPHEIFLKSTASIDAVGKTVDKSNAWKELQIFYNKLKSDGIFEQ